MKCDDSLGTTAYFTTIHQVKHVDTNTHLQLHLNTHTHARTRTHTHGLAHAHTHTHAHIHTHTLKQSNCYYYLYIPTVLSHKLFFHTETCTESTSIQPKLCQWWWWWWWRCPMAAAAGDITAHTWYTWQGGCPSRCAQVSGDIHTFFFSPSIIPILLHQTFIWAGCFNQLHIEGPGSEWVISSI